MEKLNKILARSIKKKPVAKPLESAQICFYAKEWANGLFEPISFLNGVLKVSISSSSAASELDIRKIDLIDFINNKLGKKSIRFIKIVLRNANRY